MRTVAVFITSAVMLTVLHPDASATPITDQKVKSVCGKSLQTGSIGNTTAFGCDKPCGTQICTYNCCSGPKCGEQGCHGHVVGRIVGGDQLRPLPVSVVGRLRTLARSKEPGSDMPPRALRSARKSR